MDDEQLVDLLASADSSVCTTVAASILERGERMIEPLLRVQGRSMPYAGLLGNPRGSMLTFAPLPGFPLMPKQQERVVTVEVAALYLISAIYHGRLDFASSALLVDLEVPPGLRRAANKPENIVKAFASAREWATACKKEGLEALRTRDEDPLNRAQLAFW